MDAIDAWVAARGWAPSPMNTLANKYDLSDNGLRKVCKAMDIPPSPATDQHLALEWEKLT